MRLALAALLLAAGVAVAAPEAHYAGGDGSTPAQAVVVLDAADEEQGVQAEYAWLARHFPGYGELQQSLQNQAGKTYDVLEFMTPDGAKHVVYFDISAFFGKY